MILNVCHDLASLPLQLGHYYNLSLFIQGLPWWLSWGESTCNEGDLASILGSGKSPGEENGNSFQYSCLENPHGPRSLVGYSPWGCKDSDTTEQLRTHNKNIPFWS